MTLAILLLVADGPVERDHIVAELIAGQASVQPGRALLVGLRLEPEKGWHLYWRNPGDSGLAPSIRWELPTGAKASPLRWPAPRRIPTPPNMTFGYEGEVILLAEITPPPGLKKGTLKIGAKADWLVCKEVCVTGEAAFVLKLPVSAREPERDPRIEKARGRLPRKPPKDSLRASRKAGAVLLDVRIRAEGAFFFPAKPDAVAHAAEQPCSATKEGFILTLAPAEGLERLTGVLVIETGRARVAYAVDIALPPK